MEKIEWEKIIIEKKLENISKIKDQILLEEFQKKLNSFSRTNSIDKSEIIKRIKDDDKIVQAFFAKDPNKQNIHEKIVQDFLFKKMKNLNVEILPKSGKKALYVDENGKITAGQYNRSKSIDIKITYKEFTFYCTHKYTKESGGAQDNQKQNLIYFLQNAKNNKDRNIFFIGITDGEYYSQKKVVSELEKVRAKNIFIMNTEKIPNFLIDEKFLN